MYHLMPNTVSAAQIQKNYRSVFNAVKSSGQPTIVLTNNKPDVAIVDIDYLEEIHAKIQKMEMQDALEAVRIYEEEKAAGKLVKLNSLEDLINED